MYKGALIKWTVSSRSESRLRGHGIGALVQDEHSDWKLLAHLCSSNGNMTLKWCIFVSVTELI